MFRGPYHVSTGAMLIDPKQRIRVMTGQAEVGIIMSKIFN